LSYLPMRRQVCKDLPKQTWRRFHQFFLQIFAKLFNSNNGHPGLANVFQVFVVAGSCVGKPGVDFTLIYASVFESFSNASQDVKCVAVWAIQVAKIYDDFRVLNTVVFGNIFVAFKNFVKILLQVFLLSFILDFDCKKFRHIKFGFFGCSF